MVNEAMLTGESIPQLKECIREDEADRIYDMKNDKIHTVYCGTKAVMVDNGVKVRLGLLDCLEASADVPSYG